MGSKAIKITFKERLFDVLRRSFYSINSIQVWFLYFTMYIIALFSAYVICFYIKGIKVWNISSDEKEIGLTSHGVVLIILFAILLVTCIIALFANIAIRSKKKWLKEFVQIANIKTKKESQLTIEQKVKLRTDAYMKNFIAKYKLYLLSSYIFMAIVAMIFTSFFFWAII